MSKNPYSSAHFLRRIDSTTRLSSSQGNSREMSILPRLPHQGKLAPTIGTLKTPAPQCFSTKTSITHVSDTTNNPQGVRTTSSRQDIEIAIVKNSFARDPTSAKQRYMSNSSTRVQPKNATNTTVIASKHRARNIPFQDRIDSSKQYVVSTSSHFRFNRHMRQYPKSKIPIRTTRPAKTEPMSMASSTSQETNLSHTMNQNRTTKLQPPQYTQLHARDTHQDTHPQIINNSLTPKALPEISSEPIPFQPGTPITNLYHDFIKELSHQPQAIPQLYASQLAPIQPPSTDPRSSSYDLITLPKFTIDPNDLMSLSRSGSLKKGRRATPIPQLTTSNIDIFYTPPPQSPSQHSPAQISSLLNKQPLYPLPPTPPTTPDLSKPFPTSSVSWVRNVDTSHPSSLNSSHEHTLMLQSNDPYRLSAPLASVKSTPILTSEELKYDKDTDGSTSPYAYSFPSLSDLSDLERSLSIISDGCANTNPEESTSEDVSLGVAYSTSPQEEEQLRRSYRDSMVLYSNKNDTSPSSPPSQDLILFPQSPIPTLTFESLADDMDSPNETHPPGSPHSPHAYTPRISISISTEHTESKNYEPCPPPRPIPRSRPVARILHPAPWLEESGTRSLMQGRIHAGSVGEETLSWTEVWAGCPGTGSERGRKRRLGGLLRVLGM